MDCRTVKTQTGVLCFLFQGWDADWLQRGFSQLQWVRQKQSDERQLTALSVSMCRQAKWARRQRQNDPNIHAYSALRELKKIINKWVDETYTHFRKARRWMQIEGFWHEILHIISTKTHTNQSLDHKYAVIRGDSTYAEQWLSFMKPNQAYTRC